MTNFDKLIHKLMEKKCGKNKEPKARVNQQGLMGSASRPHKVKTKVIHRKQKHKGKDLE